MTLICSHTRVSSTLYLYCPVSLVEFISLDHCLKSWVDYVAEVAFVDIGSLERGPLRASSDLAVLNERN